MDPDATVVNCIFKNNEAQAGGAIACLQNPGTGHSNLTVIDSRFIDNKAALVGGAIYIDSFSTVTVNGSNFTNNAAEKGAAIYALSDLIVLGSKFEQNTAVSGGAIFISDKYAPVNLDVDGCTFTNNSASSEGAAICIDATNGNGAAYNIFTSVFTDNIVTASGAEDCVAGGAVYAEGNATGAIIGSSFTGNKALSPNVPNGGAIKIQFGGDAIIRDCTFKANQAGESGGAISVQAWTDMDNKVEIDNCTFTNNVAQAGAAVSALQYGGLSTVTITDSRFNENKAQKGGAVYFDDLSAVTVNGSNFTNNAAENGGAIYALADLTVNDTKFEQNNAESGAGIFITDKYTNVVLKVDGCTFIDGAVKEAGGAILIDATYDKGVSYTINGSEFTNNTAIGGVDPVYCAAGGAVYIEGKALGDITNDVFTGNKVNSDVLPNGGAIKLQFGAHAVIDKCTFEANEAYSGGAIDVQAMEGNDCYAIITNSSFKNNKAVGGAAVGVLQNNGKSSVSIEDCTFEGNEAQAGDVYIDAASKVYVTDSTFTSEGVAIYNWGSLSLSKNNISTVILNKGNITSPTYIKVLDNTTTETVDYGDEVLLYAEIVDDNNNTIIGNYNVSLMVEGDNAIINTTFNPDNNKYEVNYTAHTAGEKVVTATITGEGLIDNAVQTGILKVGRINVTEFTVTVEDIVETQNASVVVTLTGLNNTGLTAEVKVILNNTEYTVNVTDGKGNITIEGLTHGTQAVVAMFAGNNDYNEAINSTVFYVKAVTFLTLEDVGDAVYGETITLNINLTDINGNGLNGLVLVNGVFKILVEDGLGVFVIDNQPDVGEYTFVAVYEGNNDYNASTSNTVSFNITKAASSVVINPVTEEIVAPGAVNITYTEVNGTASIVVKDANNNTVAAVVANGTISLADLDAGNYTVTATIDGDNNTDGSSDAITFTVAKLVTSVVIDPVTEELTYPGAVNITYTEVNGIASIVVKDANNNTVAAVVANGTISLADLDAGTYTVTATIDGDNNTVGSSDAITFTVAKLATSVVIDPVTEELLYGDDLTINYTEVNGVAVIVVKDANNNTIEAVVDNGTISLTDLAVGTYTVTATIEGDNNTVGSSDAITFEVEKDDAIVYVYPVAGVVVAPGAVNITYEAYGGTPVVVVKDANNNTIAAVVTNDTISLTDLAAGSYTVTATIEENENYTGDSDMIEFRVSAGEAAIDITNPENSTDTVFSVTLPEDATGLLLVDINGEHYYAPVVNGTASIAVPALAPGNYSANITYSGDDNYAPITESTVVSVPSNVNDTAVTIPEDGKSDAPTTYSINLPSDATGYLEVDVDGKKYIAALQNGTASVSIPALSEGSHNVTVTYSGDSKYSQVTKQTTLNVTAPVFKITKNKNVAAVYSAKANYKVLVTRDGKAVGAGEKVTIKFNGKKYTVKTDSKGYATLKLNTKVKVKKYTITATYKDVTVKNKVTIKHVIKATNKKVKKSKKVNKVKVSLKKVNGKYLKGKTLKIKFNKKTYKVKTNKKGVATWKVKKSMLKKLKVGKKYKYTVTYGKDKLTKKLTIKK